MPGAPNWMQGAPVTVQDTSPVRRLFVVIISVVEIVGGMAVAWANPVPRNTIPASAANDAAVKTDDFILVVPSLNMLGILGETEY